MCEEEALRAPDTAYTQAHANGGKGSHRAALGLPPPRHLGLVHSSGHQQRSQSEWHLLPAIRLPLQPAQALNLAAVRYKDLNRCGAHVHKHPLLVMWQIWQLANAVHFMCVLSEANSSENCQCITSPSRRAIAASAVPRALVGASITSPTARTSARTESVRAVSGTHCGTCPWGRAPAVGSVCCCGGLGGAALVPRVPPFCPPP